MLITDKIIKEFKKKFPLDNWESQNWDNEQDPAKYRKIRIREGEADPQIEFLLYAISTHKKELLKQFKHWFEEGTEDIEDFYKRILK